MMRITAYARAKTANALFAVEFEKTAGIRTRRTPRRRSIPG
jgi:hypothetical protein